MLDMNGEQLDLILRAVLGLSRRLRKERPDGSVRLTTISILGALHRIGPMSAKKLAAEEGLKPQSITRIVNTLEERGCVVREINSTDRREVLISLTDRG